MKQLIKESKKSLLIIALYHIISQGAVLIVSGLWFDDWCIINMSSKGLLSWALEMGKPDYFPVVFVINHIPPILYKIFIFFAYLVIACCFFFICKLVLDFSDSRSLVTVLIYMSVPVNDVRIERLDIPYTVGLLLFAIAFLFLAYNYNELTVLKRIIALCIFFLSFTLNSILVFYGIVMLYIIIKEKNVKSILKKIDFFVLPFVFFIIKILCFPAHGAYENYNKVSIASLLLAVKNVFISSGLTFYTIFSQFFQLKLIALIGGAAYLVCIVYEIATKTTIDAKSDCKKRIGISEIIIGYIMLLAGLFPYVVVQKSPYIATSGFNGRYAMLVPFGIALIIGSIVFYLCNWRGIVVLVSVFSFAGLLFFTKCYINYQAMYYWDCGLQEYLKMSPELGGCKSIYIDGEGVNGSETPWYEGLNFYQYNGMFEEIYGNETRLVFDGYSSVNLDAYLANGFSDPIVLEREQYNMMNYDETHRGLDAVIVYSNSISLRKAASLRVKELLGRDISYDLIFGSEFYVYYPGDWEYDYYVNNQ